LLSGTVNLQIRYTQRALCVPRSITASDQSGVFRPPETRIAADFNRLHHYKTISGSPSALALH
jgi:hypothetical protein